MGIELATGVHNRGGQSFFAIEEAYHLNDIVHAIHVEVVDHSCLAGILSREDEPLVTQLASLDSYGKSALDGHEVAIEPQLAHDEITGKPVGDNHVARRQDANRNGEVVG